MNNSLIGKSKIPLQFRMLHTLLGFAIFFSLITIPDEAQVIHLFAVATSAEFLWWPIVIFVLKLIYYVYGFAYLRHALYSIILFRAIYIVFLKFAIWLPASSFWTMQEIYTQVLGRDIFYLIKSSVFLWACILLPMRFIGIKNEKQARYIFLFSLITFCLLNIVFNVWITTVLGIGNNDSFELILHNQTRMFIASGAAFFLGMTINSTAISILKARQRNRGISLKKEFITTVWTRIATSSAFGIMIDVSIFPLISFYDIVPTEKLGSVIFFEDIYKISYEVLLAPVSILLIYFLKIKEKVDIYDERSNLNPFKIETNYKFSANRFDENYTKLKERENG
jgi:uncharacterized PurR-regulated membrane protein YhhQ (DUF165 family)